VLVCAKFRSAELAALGGEHVGERGGAFLAVPERGRRLVWRLVRGGTPGRGTRRPVPAARPAQPDPSPAPAAADQRHGRALHPHHAVGVGRRRRPCLLDPAQRGAGAGRHRPRHPCPAPETTAPSATNRCPPAAATPATTRPGTTSKTPGLRAAPAIRGSLRALGATVCGSGGSAEPPQIGDSAQLRGSAEGISCPPRPNHDSRGQLPITPNSPLGANGRTLRRRADRRRTPAPAARAPRQHLPPQPGGDRSRHGR
jgi:hypothetical protein